MAAIGKNQVADLIPFFQSTAFTQEENGFGVDGSEGRSITVAAPGATLPKLMVILLRWRIALGGRFR